MEKRPALGKGLSALIPDAADALALPRAPLDVDIDLLEPNQYQPRGAMDESSLEGLARSIRSNGVIQPIVVRRLEGGTGRARYQIIAGERRWRAAQRAQLAKVPVVIKEKRCGCSRWPSSRTSSARTSTRWMPQRLTSGSWMSFT